MLEVRFNLWKHICAVRHMVTRFFSFVCALVVIQTFFLYGIMSESQGASTRKRPPKPFRLRPVTFAELPDWRKDNHQAAFAAFLKSCTQILASEVRIAKLGEAIQPKRLSTVCRAARKFKRPPAPEVARAFFETWFRPHIVDAPGQKSLLTGYYEPELKGSRTRTDRYYVPIYRRPKDLVELQSRAGKGKKFKKLSFARKTSNGLEPYHTRAEIEQGALRGRGLEILYLEDEVETFFMHVQGSGRIVLPNGQRVRIAYEAKNGYPYTSIGKRMIALGQVPKDGMSMDAVKRWLRKDLKRGRKLMWENKSFIFFKELSARTGHLGPLGAMDIPLTTKRSLAVDTRYHDLGLPIYVVCPSMRHHGRNGFRQLMIAQDVGSAIKGAERGDIYWGEGEKAGKLAGNTGCTGKFFVLLPAKK